MTAPDDGFVRRLPKAELHLHIEGTLEPEMMLGLARRNGVALRFKSAAELRAAYRFSDLQSFLDLYYEGAGVLLEERDFYELTWAYCEKAVRDGVRHAEVFFDPQTHTARGVPFKTVLDGIHRALSEARRRLGLTSALILCFLRHLSEREALETLEEALPHRERLAAVGLDSSEAGHPPSKFAAAFRRAREAGLRAVAHAGEEGPPSYVWEALDLLKVSRVDHGIRSLEDPALVRRLSRDRTPLTVCPLSNLRLKVVPSLAAHPLRRMLEAGLAATVNSDDPAYFGGYAGDNLLAAREALGLGRRELVRLARNSIEASFLEEGAKAGLLRELGDLAG